MRTTIAKSEKEMAEMERLKRLPIPKPLNFSQALKVAKRLFGVKARIWHNNRETVEVGLQGNEGRVVLAVGASFDDALKKAKDAVKAAKQAAKPTQG